MIRRKLWYGIVLFCVGLYFVNLAGCQKQGDEDTEEEPADSYVVETIQMPEGVKAEIGALEFLPDGRLAVGFIRGEIMFYDPETEGWELFAEGLHEPLGMKVIDESEILVMQRPELTRVKDTDGDGQADYFETVTDAFGITGNYHEFNYGPVEDEEGNIFIALNSASKGGDVQPEVRGRLDTSGRVDQGMFSVVPYRGWIMKLHPNGILEPYASGFRSPNGIGFDPGGRLFVTDNQGDWVGTSTLFHIQKGNFYGHPASLIWKADWDQGNPFELPVEELSAMRTRAAVLFPQDIIANSPTEPIWDVTEGKFGPFAGQMFVGEMNLSSSRIVRVMLEEVDGVMQGACTPFLGEESGIRIGNNRLAFAPDGSLWVGQAQYGWGGDNGIQRIVYTGKPPFDILNMSLTKEGFELTFTEPIDLQSGEDLGNYLFSRFHYEYHAKYGSDRVDEEDVDVLGVEMSEDGKKAVLTLGELLPGYVYRLDVGELKNDDGDVMENRVICYTVNQLREG